MNDESEIKNKKDSNTDDQFGNNFFNDEFADLENEYNQNNMDDGMSPLDGL